MSKFTFIIRLKGHLNIKHNLKNKISYLKKNKLDLHLN